MKNTELTFYTRDVVADAILKIGNAELKKRYLANTKRMFVLTENPVKNSFEWKSTEEGAYFWAWVSRALDAAIAFGKIKITAKPVTLEEMNDIYSVSKFVKAEFLPWSPSVATNPDDDWVTISSLDDLMEYLTSKSIGETTVDNDDNDDDTTDFDDDDEVTGEKIKDDAVQFADDMMKYIKEQAIKRIIKGLKKDGN